MYNISDICFYKKVDESRSQLAFSYVKRNGYSEIDIKRINRNIKIDNLLNKTDYNLKEYHSDRIEINVESLILSATRFISKQHVYDFIIDKIIFSNKTHTLLSTDILPTNIYHYISKECQNISLVNRMDYNTLVALVNPNNSYLFTTDEFQINKYSNINIIYNYRVPVDEVIIHSISNEMEIGLKVFQGNSNIFYISDVNFENMISKIKLKRTIL